MKQALTVALVLTAIAGIGLFAFRSNLPSREHSTGNRDGAVGVQETARPASAASSAVRPAKAVALAWRAPESPELAHLRSRKDLASLHRQVQASTTAEALYVKAVIYARCARRPDELSRGAQGQAARREKFLAGLPPNAVDAGRRIQAYDALGVDPCEQVDLGDFSERTLAGLLAKAADAGDVRARAWELAESIEHADRLASSERGRGPRGYDYGEAELAQMRELLASGDPDVMRSLQGVLSSSLQAGAITLNGEPVDPHSMHAAFTLLRCDAGAICGGNAPQLLAHCAHRGRCDANSVHEYIYYYDHSPSQGLQIDRYRQQLASMLNARDFSRLTITPTRGPPQSTITFGGFERP